MSRRTFVIVGAGQAGGWAAKSLRDNGFDGRVVLIGDETEAPYERPPLSKGILTGTTTAKELTLFSADQLLKLEVEFFPNCIVQAVFPDRRLVQTDRGQQIYYDKLLISTGGRALIPPFPGSDSRDVFSLRNLTDAESIKLRLGQSRGHVVVVGAGWIGLEIAATARSLGHEVTLIEMTDRVCSRSVMPQVSEQLADLHRSHGVKLLLNAEVADIRCVDSEYSRVTLTSGETLIARTIVLGAGLIANDRLAREAGLVCDRGVLVNDQCQTSDPDIYAAGDVAVIRFEHLSLQCRLESWQNAQDQGIAAAKAMLGQHVSYQPVPRVWSDQYACQIQIAGHAQLACKTVLRNTEDPVSKLFFGLDAQNRIVAAVAFNGGREFRAVRKLVEMSTQVDPQVLADLSRSLSDMTRSEAHVTGARSTVQ